MELTGRMLPGTEIAAALAAIDPLKPDVIGINCATGPVEMGEHLRHLAAHARMPISCIPNAGLPSVVDGEMHYDLTPDQLAEHQARFVTELGVNVIGGCCGTTPEPPGRGGRALPRPRGRPPPPHPRGGRHLDLLAGPVRAGHLVHDHRRAHQRQRLQEVPRRHARGRPRHLRADGQGPGEGGRPRPRPLRRLRGPRRRRRHGRAGQAARHPGQRARSCSTRPRPR